MMLLLADFLGVRDVSWVSHQLIWRLSKAGRSYIATRLLTSSNVDRPSAACTISRTGDWIH